MQASGSAAIKKLIQLVKASLSGKMDKSGGTFTGNVSGQCFTGTLLQSTAATDLGKTPGKIAVLDDAGWVHYRTPAELLADIGASGGGVDYVTEQGATGRWAWRKWASGVAEMWAVFGTDTLAIDEAWGSLYFGTWMDSAQNVEARKYPFAFVAAPMVSASYSGGDRDAWLISAFKASDDLLTGAPAYALARPNIATILTPRISYYVVGKYK